MVRGRLDSIGSPVIERPKAFSCNCNSLYFIVTGETAERIAVNVGKRPGKRYRLPTSLMRVAYVRLLKKDSCFVTIRKSPLNPVQGCWGCWSSHQARGRKKQLEKKEQTFTFLFKLLNDNFFLHHVTT